MKRKSDIYYVLVVKDASPILLKFKSKKTAKKYVDDFRTTHGIKNDGNWIDLFFRGKVYEADSSFEDSV